MRRILITTSLALSALLLSGCSLASGSMSAPDSGLTNPQMEAPVAGDPGTGGVASGGSKDAVSGPQIITTVQLTVTVDKPMAAADEVANIAGRFGGNVSNRTEIAPTEKAPGSAQMTLRVPSANLTQTLDAIKKLGVSRDTTISSTDVTAESTDLTARITALQTSVDRLLTLMSQATTTDNLLAVETALSSRQADLDSLKAQKRYLDDQVQMSTVNLNLISQMDTPATTPDTFWTGLVTGWNAFVGFWAGVLVVLGVVAPWLVAGAIIAAIVIVWVKRARRRPKAE